MLFIDCQILSDLELRLFTQEIAERLNIKQVLYNFIQSTLDDFARNTKLICRFRFINVDSRQGLKVTFFGYNFKQNGISPLVFVVVSIFTISFFK